MTLNKGPAASVQLQFRQYPFNHGRLYQDTATGHTLTRSNQRWKCNQCSFDVVERDYSTWRGIVEDHRRYNGRN